MKNCRICNYRATEIISFGKMPIANNFLEKQNFEKEYFFNLMALFCDFCKTFQLADQPKPELMFHENYAFFSSSSKKMSLHFEQMAHHYFNQFLLNKEQSFVVELGSNDGIMLQHFAQKNIKHLGIEPSDNVAQVARNKGINTITDFFQEELAIAIEKQYGKADIISAANVMCHISDLASVAKGVIHLLKKTGVFVFEEPYLGDMIQKTSYDQIYDEHVYIFSLLSVINIFKPYGLQVFHVEPQVTHGGSMRYYLGFENQHIINKSVSEQLLKEKKLGLDVLETFYAFKNACEKNKTEFIALLHTLKKQNKRIVGYAATSKSTTVLNYCNIGSDCIEYISDTTPIKQGKFSPGVHIPIKTYQNFKDDMPDYAILFAWNHAQEIFEKEEEFIKKGGKWITFVPEVKILNMI